MVPPDRVDEAGQETALVVASLVADGPAIEAGFTLGDALLTLDGQVLGNGRSLLRALSTRAKRQVTVRLLRGGQPLELAVTLGDRPVPRGCG